MNTRKELVKATTKRYQKANKITKATILDEFCATTQYNRDYAAILLRSGCSRWLKPKKPSTPFKTPGRRGGRPPVYDKDIIRILGVVWLFFDHICAKRLIPLIRSSIVSL